MSVAAQGQESATEATGAKKGSARERSTIGFPYLALDEAIEVANAIHRNVGTGACSDDQLAPWLSLSQKSSGYRLRIYTTKMFGLIDSPSPGAYQMTDLGRRIVDPVQEPKAKAEAFLEVPLFSAVFNKFRGGTLPPTTALEVELRTLGVAQKQTSKARSSFERSAHSAGYFHEGRNRLVKPGFAEIKTKAEDPAPDKKSASENNGKKGRHPLIEGLLATLPSEDGNWSVEERVVWLKTAATGFDLIYGIEGTITIEGSASGAK